ncbi:hypothetical protein TH53_20065 [Pedobacter lusitanus]|uniref:Uncharacterized protein n=1 Tax=Pedobacter lusitanus TaxID=1503925 RepID=A0A0D0GM81_9SPHI|nr:RagB/SusD family nutrient uptake outer membrane protein [Pedobacter lusitanus]KIO75546.1 hypothetical protein TH53_20065 [Pedobacter lusitanus]
MKIFNIKYRVLAVGLLMLLSCFTFSCKKALENNLENATYENSFWQNEKDVDGAVLGAYALLRKSLFRDNCFFLWGDGPVGIFNSDDTNVSGMYTSGSFTVAYRQEGAHNWTNWFQIVSLSNLVLEKAGALPDAKFAAGRKNYLLGEAYFLRALSYFYMTRVWGDVPLQLTAITTADQVKLIGTTDEKLIMNQVIADATKASALLTWDGLGENQRIRASKASALALLAHASAWKNDYAKTVLYTDSLISRADLFNLEPKGAIRKVFSNTSSSENIFVIPSKYANNESSSNSTIAFLTVSSDIVKGMPNSNPTYWLSPIALDNLYSTDDARKKEFVAYRSVSDLKPNLVKYADIQNVGSDGKYDLRAESNLIIFRLADIILLKAEALNALGRDGEALTAINQIRTRSGVASVSSSSLLLKRDILLERERELIGEGQSYFDIVRNSRSYGIDGSGFYPSWMNKDRFSKKGWLWPINNSIINANSLISQNEWWKGRY